MKIGVDLDGVIFDSEKEFRIYSELFDMIDLKQNSKRNNKEIRFQDRFNWTQEQTEKFIQKYHMLIEVKSNIMPGARQVLKMLKEEGHELIVVTARGGYNEVMIEVTEAKLKECGIYDIFNKYYWKTENKEQICLQEKVDVMIDDSYYQCTKISKEKIKTIYLKDAPCYDLEENEYLKTLYNWGEIYRYLHEIQ